jgi:hypothetical protein
MKSRVLCVFETLWDRKQLAACREAWDARVEVAFCAPADADCSADFEALGFVERAAAGELGRIDAVITSSDYPGAVVSAAVAARLGLSGPRIAAVLRGAHKWYSRLAQRDVVPEAVPRFALVDPLQPERPLDLAFPCFVKPVKGSFSLLARRMENRAELEAFLASPPVREFAEYYVRIFDRLLREFTDFEVSARHFLAEELLHGPLVTVEGYAFNGRVELLGVVDSIVHPQSRSFVRFEYPSALPESVQKRMADVAQRTALALELDRTLFNVEMTWDPRTDRIGVIEVNPRICGQFADLYQKVDGTSGYEISLALATGEPPRLQRRAGEHAFACSIPLRVFERTGVERAPSAADVTAAESLYPGTLIWPECRTGDVLADFASEDGHSARYAVLNLGAPDRPALLERARAVQDRLGFQLAPLPVV